MKVETHGNVYMFRKQLRRCEENAHNSVIQEKLDKLDAFYEEILELQVQLEEEHSIQERADEVERWRVLDVRVNAAGTVIQEKIRFQITADAEGIGKLCPSLAEIWLNSLGSGNSSQPVWISGHTSTQQSRSIEQEVQRSVAKAGEMERLSETVPIRMREFERQWCVQRSSALFAWFSHQEQSRSGAQVTIAEVSSGERIFFPAIKAGSMGLMAIMWTPVVCSKVVQNDHSFRVTSQSQSDLKELSNRSRSPELEA
ncbi:hypothetical protein T11_13416 [Trichinella zimbabwensis]|uniref:Uncharacterized protein n=1 Tax=Trichinella zimbabwensis TaxID=268475 RepID=A0A0V1H5T7_9BILA|nr:hypothetical protein T11_13416 [Trichinella zimbabwensis]